ncbi:MAG: thioredoxin domain-containing protein [Gammaproteobacteria bacterium]|nr:thioredoxin domain-containing protein [Gammaproteobacteria bacterium]
MKQIENMYSWAALVVMCLVLASCGDNKKSSSDKTWPQEEILQQLSEQKQEINTLKKDLAAIKQQLASAGSPQPTGPKTVKLNTDITLGDPNAKLAIIEFTDYQCPYCARHNQSVLPAIKKQLIETGKAKYMMYDFPLGFHAQAKPAAIAARCAGEQGKYWQMHDALFANQRKLGSALYETTAKELALDEAAFISCTSNPAVMAKVEADFNYGGQIGVSGARQCELFSCPVADGFLRTVTRDLPGSQHEISRTGCWWL